MIRTNQSEEACEARMIDIGSGKGYPQESLSNFSPHSFVLDGVECASMEGFLQSLKFENRRVEEEVCRLIGKSAKFRGKKRNKAWKRVQKLWWRCAEYDRYGGRYQLLLDRAFYSLARNERFIKALIATESLSKEIDRLVASIQQD